ncbi:MAG: PTS sugar transporter subunit IIA [Spirochaetales bacterium]|jgi:fructose-specific phosphotransferase system IIA component|nr:PTS sugar transporter subunit IIA [Spirochaetales bacterium]
MELLDILSTNCIKVPLLGDNKEEVIRELLDLLEAAGGIVDKAKTFAAIMDRELLGSTGLERGVAIPHAKTEGVNRVLLSIGIKPTGIDFQSIDGELSRLFFLILAPPDKAGHHIEILTELAKATKSQAFCRLLSAARTPEEVIELFTEE